MEKYLTWENFCSPRLYTARFMITKMFLIASPQKCPEHSRTQGKASMSAREFITLTISTPLLLTILGVVLSISPNSSHSRVWGFLEGVLDVALIDKKCGRRVALLLTPSVSVVFNFFCLLWIHYSYTLVVVRWFDVPIEHVMTKLRQYFHLFKHWTFVVGKDDIS